MAILQLLIATALFSIGLLLVFYVAENFSIFLLNGTESKKTHPKVRKAIIQKANLSKDGHFVDLGSGTGSLVHEAHTAIGCKATGYEKSILKVLAAKTRNFLSKSQNVTHKWKNLLKADLRSANVIFCALSPKLMKKLSKKFESELQNGTQILSEYKVPGLEPVDIHEWGPLYARKKIYEYEYQKLTF